MPVEQQVVILFAAVKGYLDTLQLPSIAAFQEQLLQRVAQTTLAQIREKKTLTPELESDLHALCAGLIKETA